MLANSSENVDNAAAADDDDYDDGGDDDIYGHDHDFAICLKKRCFFKISFWQKAILLIDQVDVCKRSGIITSMRVDVSLSQ